MSSAGKKGVQVKRRTVPLLIAAFLIALIACSTANGSTLYPLGFWKSSATGGFGIGTDNMVVTSVIEYGGKMYAGTLNRNSGAQVWVKNESGAWESVLNGGWGTKDNSGAVRMAVYGGYLYVGAMNQGGCGIWKYDGSNWTDTLSPGPGPGFGNTKNIAVSALCVFNGQLYAGLTNFEISTSPGSQGPEVWRYDGAAWTRDDVDEINDDNAGITAMAEYDGVLYACTARFTVSASIIGIPVIRLTLNSKGCDLWRRDAGGWVRMATNGFTNTRNLAAAAMQVYDGLLYIGTANATVSLDLDLSTFEVTNVIFNTDGLSVYSYDGASLTPVITGGFGTTDDIAVAAMGVVTVGTDEFLIVGTAGGDENNPVPAKLKLYDGATWSDGADAGFGNTRNSGFFGLASRTENGALVVYAGTSNDQSGGEVWETTLTPRLDGISPMYRTAGGAGFTLSLNGDYFIEGTSVVKWDSTERTPTFVTATQLTLSVSAEDIALADVVEVRVSNPVPGGGDSSPQYLTINNPVPAITALDPPNKVVGEEGFELTVNGTGFVDTSVLTWDGATKAVVFDSPTQLRTSVSTSDLAAVGTHPVVVTNPGPGGGASNTFDFVVKPLPTITRISPAFGQGGTTVVLSGDSFGDSQGGSHVTFNGQDAAGYTSWTDSSITVKAPLDVKTGPVVIVAPMGISNTDKIFTLTRPTWYLAEGTSDWGFTTYVVIANPNGAAVTARVSYMTGDGLTTRPDITLPANSQTTINPYNDIGSKDFSTRVDCLQGRTIAVDRTMIWTGSGAASPEAHASVGVTSPDRTWYLPEGSSKWGFETWLLIQNPNSTDAVCDLLFMTENSGEIPVSVTVPPNSRKSYNMADYVGAADSSIKVSADSPVIAERAMYRNNRREGHCSVGTTSPSTSYYLAEGTTDWGFTTYVLVQNPNNATNTVTVTYMTTEGSVEQEPFVMQPNSRKTINVNDLLPGEDLSTYATGSRPIVVERAMYWDNGTGEACHDSIGLARPYPKFYFADGQSSGGWETWTLVQNPNSVGVKVRITYLLAGGGTKKVEDDVPANSRKTYAMKEVLDGRAGMIVECLSGKSIMSERAMYFNNRGGGTSTIGGFSD